MPLLLQVALIFAVLLITIPVAKRLGVVTVLAYLLTGLLIGPQVLSLAQDSELIRGTVHTGLILVMFLLGFELKLWQLWVQRQALAKISFVPFSLTLILLLAISWGGFNIALNQGVVIAIALGLSSTLLVFQLLSQYKLLNSHYGQLATRIQSWQLLLGMTILALIPLFTGQPSPHHGIAYLAAVVACYSGFYLLHRYAFDFIVRITHKAVSTEVILLIGLFIVTAVIALLQLIGISTALAAFLAGILLSESAFKDQFSSILSPFKPVMIGVFFLGIGMLLPLAPLFQYSLILPLLALGLVITKLLGTLVVLHFLGQNWKDSLFTGLALATVGELGMVILGVALNESLIEAQLFSQLLWLLCLSMLISTALYALAERWLKPYLARLDQQDASEDTETGIYPPLIILGFGRMGQIIARIAHLNQLAFSVVDRQTTTEFNLAPYGGRFYLGDCRQPQLLQQIGLEFTRTVVIAVDDIESSLLIARFLRLNYPQIQVIARARDRFHWQLLQELGIHTVWRETYHSTLVMAYQALTGTGLDSDQVKSSLEEFRQLDEQILGAQHMIAADDIQSYTHLSTSADEIEAMFRQDARHMHPTAKDYSYADSEGAQADTIQQQRSTEDSSTIKD